VENGGAASVKGSYNDACLNEEVCENEDHTPGHRGAMVKIVNRRINAKATFGC
jgi:hypothetical protein